MREILELLILIKSLSGFKTSNEKQMLKQEAIKEILELHKDNEVILQYGKERLTKILFKKAGLPAFESIEERERFIRFCKVLQLRFDFSEKQTLAASPYYVYTKKSGRVFLSVLDRFKGGLCFGLTCFFYLYTAYFIFPITTPNPGLLEILLVLICSFLTCLFAYLSHREFIALMIGRRTKFKAIRI